MVRGAWGSKRLGAFSTANRVALSQLDIVIPAKAGISGKRSNTAHEIPAFAGMTDRFRRPYSSFSMSAAISSGLVCGA